MKIITKKYYLTKTIIEHGVLKCCNHLSNALSLELCFSLVQGHQAFPAHWPDIRATMIGMRGTGLGSETSTWRPCTDQDLTPGTSLWRNRPKLRRLQKPVSWAPYLLTRESAWLDCVLFWLYPAGVSSCCPLMWIPVLPEDYLMEQGVKDLSTPTAWTCSWLYRSYEWTVSFLGAGEGPPQFESQQPSKDSV